MGLVVVREHGGEGDVQDEGGTGGDNVGEATVNTVSSVASCAGVCLWSRGRTPNLHSGHNQS